MQRQTDGPKQPLASCMLHACTVSAGETIETGGSTSPAASNYAAVVCSWLATYSTPILPCASAARLLTVGHNCILTPQVLAQALEGTVPLPVAGVQQVLGPLLLFRGRRYHRQEVQMRAAGGLNKPMQYLQHT